MSTAVQTSFIEDVVKRAWRRRLLVLAVDQSALALALVFAGFVLLILLGSQILAWQWLLLLAAIGVGIGVYGVRRHLSDPYRVAQMMDEHLSLQDSLSTAWFLHSNGLADLNAPAAEFQLKRAEQLARTADPARAFPFQRRRAWIVTAALCLLALGLFSARYLITRELSLSHSFLPLAITQVFENLRNGKTNADSNDQDAQSRLANSLPPGAVGQDAEQRAQASKAEQAKQASEGQSKSGDADPKGDDPNQNSQQGKGTDGRASDEKRNGDGKASQNPANSEAAKQTQPGDKSENSKQADATGEQKSSSLMERMRDALSSVMAKIKPTGNNPNQQANSQKSPAGQKGSEQSNNKDQSADGSKDAGKDQSAQEQASGEQPQQGAAKAQASQGKDSAQPSDKKGSDAQSGVGHSDGDKEVRAAEQAKAMGKLAEIIGKRSASLTGEMQVEPSGKQHLQTEYTHKLGHHADLGGEINRDEVPVEDQEYVREYMELVRKKAPIDQPSRPKQKSPDLVEPQ
jgi:hypothetical protein